MAVMVTWSIWSSRNSVLHGEKATHLTGGVARSLCLFSEFKAAHALLQPVLPERRSVADTRWQKPPVSVVKVNYDAFVRRNGFVGIGFVIRDNRGKVL